jgi:hypothetical protein
MPGKKNTWAIVVHYRGYGGISLSDVPGKPLVEAEINKNSLFLERVQADIAYQRGISSFITEDMAGNR